MDIGKQIQMARKNAGFTQRDLADRLGINAVNISQIETGSRTPSLDTVQRIADALDIDIRELFAVGEETKIIDREYENIVEIIRSVGLAIEETGRSEGPDASGDYFYIWHDDTDDPEEDRVAITYGELIKIIDSAVRAADRKREEYLKKRLEVDIF